MFSKFMAVCSRISMQAADAPIKANYALLLCIIARTF
jgi:hypothetical protein